MRTVGIIAIAYVLTGVHYVLRDFRQPIWRRPSYTHRGEGWWMFTVFYWLPGTIFAAYLRGPNMQHVVSWMIFGGLLLAGLVLGATL